MIQPLKSILAVDVLETKRLSLEPLSKYFLSQVYVNWLNDDVVNQYLVSGGDYTLEKLQQYLEEVERKPKYFWAIKLKETNKHIGNIKIDPINLNDLSGEYGIMIGDRSTWGKGIGKEASEIVLAFCFETLHLKKITLGVQKNNLKAIRLYEKLGFTLEKQSESNEAIHPHHRMFLYNPKTV